MTQNASRRASTEDELVQILALYYGVPFGKTHRRNPLVVAFARSLQRTPASIALKLVNFASFGPALRERGVRGMSNASRLGRVVWDRFSAAWGVLASVDTAAQIAGRHWMGRQTETERTTVVRLGQGFFRNAVLSAYEGACCITGIHGPQLLRASHIIPWSVSEARRLDPSSGVCLNALHDAAFDAGLTGFDERSRVLVSRAAQDLMPSAAFTDFFARYAGQLIRASERFAPSPEALQYHREHVFIA